MTQPNTLPKPPRRASLPLILLALMMLTYVAFFSAYTLQRHATLNTFAADLSFIDQPMWNTLHGRFLERTLGATQAPRLAEHFEPILVPLSLVYIVWDDVRAMLILQSLALAFGALPVFWIARRAFTGVTGETGPADTRRAEWIALAFSAAYLLFPALQAANVADFHADPLAVAPLLFAFWYGTERRWRAMWFWAILVMASKETLPTLTAMLGLLLVLLDPALRSDWRAPSRPLAARLRASWSSPGVRHGLALIVVSAAWYLIATFLIVAPLARQYYGTNGPIYFDSRYAFEGGLFGWLSGALSLLREPARLAYLAGLFSSVGWLALLGPEFLLLGLPVLVANTLSSYPGQYSGEQHYSAPLAAAFIVAAIYGARRLQRFLERQIPFRFSPMLKNATLVSALVVAWLLVFSFSAQRDRGWTPLAWPFAWPAATEHHRALPALLAQVPPDASVSATPAVHPHLAHREKIYVYPELGDATHVLIDVAGVTDMQAGDVRASVDKLLGEGFGVVDAANGFVLLAQGAADKTLPDAFYDFARVSDPQPQIPVNAQFGSSLKLRGYDVVDDARLRLTRFRFYFDVLEQPPADLTIRYEARSASGELVDSAEQRPLPALAWYAAENWRPGETIVLETVPWFLPRSFAPVLQVESGGQVQRPEVLPTPPLAQVGPLPPPQLPEFVTEVTGDGGLRLPGLARREGRLDLWEGPLYPVEPVDAAFAGEDWTVRLREWSAPLAVAPGAEFPALFYWQSGRIAPKDYNVFVHLRDATGQTVAQDDGPPTLFVDRPATQWRMGGDGLAGATDAHTIRVPADVQPGRYEVVVGWYDWETGQRLQRTAGAGRPSAGEIDRNEGGDEFVLGVITVDPGAAVAPDAICLMAPEACASLE